MDVQAPKNGRPVIKTRREINQHEFLWPRGYLRVLALLIGLWLAFLYAVARSVAANGSPMPDLQHWVWEGCIGIAFALAFLFLAHSLIKLMLCERRYDAERLAHQQWLNSEAQRVFSLEIQGTGLGMHGITLKRIWTSLSNGEQTVPFAPTASPHDYTTRDWLFPLRRAAFRGSAAHAVTFWPIPTFVVGSLRPAHEQVSAAWMINEGRNAAVLGQTQFVAQFAERGDKTQAMIEKLFAFMEKHRGVPQALLVSDEEGGAARTGASPVANTAAMLLSNRVSGLERSSVDTPTGEAFMRTAPGRLWTFFWQTDKAYAAEYQQRRTAASEPPVIIPRTMPTEYWHAHLPDFMSTYEDDGPYFEPSLWRPVRWGRFQLEAYKSAPVLGYLHRPIKVAMPKTASDPASRHSLGLFEDGWIHALNTLPVGERPVRVFYDSRQQGFKTMLMQALGVLVGKAGVAEEPPLEMYDLGMRVGVTGVGSTLLLLNVATEASYQSGGISAVVYVGEDQSITVQMVRPPDADRKKQNQRNAEAAEAGQT
ncbi:type VI lipase adapter Tla3 domain-containing protein [Pseudomonas sp.]|jgi:hypothetical protein|uniref:type VI lipase adapter Tla3 domain-containing protein n=1 Tax=Pseudomonas sp. TaxID=306 RepID=UPI002ED84E1B